MGAKVWGPRGDPLAPSVHFPRHSTSRGPVAPKQKHGSMPAPRQDSDDLAWPEILYAARASRATSVHIRDREDTAPCERVDIRPQHAGEIAAYDGATALSLQGFIQRLEELSWSAPSRFASEARARINGSFLPINQTVDEDELFILVTRRTPLRSSVSQPDPLRQARDPRTMISDD